VKSQLSEPKVIRLAIISDPHAFHGKSGDESPSWIAMEDDQSNPSANPFAGVQKLIRDHQLSADLLICGGDLGDKAVPQAQQYAWGQINQISDLLGAKEVLAAAGNHDVDSRFSYNDHDAKGQLLSLDPRFPTKHEPKWLEYWARNYTILSVHGIRFTLINSSAFHGYQKPSDGNNCGEYPPEYLNGRVTDRMLESLKLDLGKLGEHPINILLCHHHPAKNDVVGLNDYSHMKNGDRLLNLLDEVDVGPWLVLHGHKHIPRIFNAPGSSSSPIIFSAGSFAAKLYPQIQDIARCEFYIMDLIVPDVMTSGSVKGKISVWQWSFGNGWKRGKKGNGLGFSAAFGSRLDVDDLASETAKKLKLANSGKRISWQDVVSIEPKIEYLSPDDAKRFYERLSKRHGVEALHNDSGEILELQVPQ